MASDDAAPALAPPVVSIAAAAAAAAAASQATCPMSASAVVRSLWGGGSCSQLAYQPPRHSLGGIAIGDTGGSSSGTSLPMQPTDASSASMPLGHTQSAGQSPRGRRLAAQQPQAKAQPRRSAAAAPPPPAPSAALGSGACRSMDRLDGGGKAKPGAKAQASSPVQTPREQKRISGGGGKGPRLPQQSQLNSPTMSPRGTGSPTASATASTRSVTGSPFATGALSTRSLCSASAAAAPSSPCSPESRLRSPGRSSVASAASSPRNQGEGAVCSPRSYAARRLADRPSPRHTSLDEKRTPGGKGRAPAKSAKPCVASPRGASCASSASEGPAAPARKQAVRIQGGGGGEGGRSIRPGIGRRASDGGCSIFSIGEGQRAPDLMSRASSVATTEMADVALLKSNMLLQELAKLTAASDEAPYHRYGAEPQDDFYAMMSPKASTKSVRAASPELVKEMAEIRQCLQHIQHQLDVRPGEGRQIFGLPGGHPALIRAMPQLICPSRCVSSERGHIQQMALADKSPGSPPVPIGIATLSSQGKMKPWSSNSTVVLGSSVCEGIASGNSAASSTTQFLQHRPCEQQPGMEGRHMVCMPPPSSSPVGIGRKTSSEVNLQPVVVTELHRYIAWTAQGRPASPEEPCKFSAESPRRYVTWGAPGRPMPGSARFTATL